MHCDEQAGLLPTMTGQWDPKDTFKELWEPTLTSCMKGWLAT